MNFIRNRNFRAGPQTSLEGFICPQNSDKQQKIKVFGRSGEGVKVVSVSSSETVSASSEIVLASDGYPFLKPTLAESEEALANQIANDPQNISSFIATKGLVEGNKSFDDRTYIRFLP